MSRRLHHMPFGSELLDDGRVRFRLWAPGAREVGLCLGVGPLEETLAMAAEAEGWFGLITERATAGTYYRFHIDSGLRVPDPAARFQPGDVHGHSQVIDPAAWNWTDDDWRGRPWEEAVFYELHVGSFTPEGTFVAASERLDYLAELGVTAIELMPVADFPGERNWGYDGVLPFAPDARYGTPDEFKALIQAAHAHGLMVFLDVVHNHFGPEGNYLNAYAPQFFTDRHHTPWGAAINFDGQGSAWVRKFFIHNALYWLEEYNLDGLRLDAVHAILDDSTPDILIELAEAVRHVVGTDRHVHLVLENDHNAAHYLERRSGRPRWYTAQWNDDIHHALHVLLTGETQGYYMDYTRQPLDHLARCLTEGFAYQGERSAYRDQQPRGEPSAQLPPTAFVSFLQNHDQIGNRAFGERITALAASEAVRAVTAVLLLAPSPPLLFMGEEWGASAPFPFFCDFEPPLAQRVTKGRREEFLRFPQFRDSATRARIPDPVDPATFGSARLDWQEIGQPEHRDWLRLHRELLAIRAREIVPRLAGLGAGQAASQLPTPGTLQVRWRLPQGDRLILLCQLAGEAGVERLMSPGRVLYATHPEALGRGASAALPPWSVLWMIQEGGHTP